MGRCSGDEKVKKVIAWQGKTTTLHVHYAFLFISLPSLHDYHVKMPIISRFVKDVNKQGQNFLTLYELGYG